MSSVVSGALQAAQFAVMRGMQMFTYCGLTFDVMNVSANEHCVWCDGKYAGIRVRRLGTRVIAEVA